MLSRLILAGLLLAGALSYGFNASAGQHGMQGPKRFIAVQGIGVVTTRPDMAVLQAGVTAQAPSAKAALAQHNKAMANILKDLSAFGLSDRDVQTRQVNLRPIYPRRKGAEEAPAPIAFRATGNLQIRLREIDRLGDLLDRLTAAGVNNLSGLNFTVAEPEALQDEARKKAVQDARRKAELYANEAGVELGDVLRISEGSVAAPMRELRAMAMSDSSSPIAVGESEIRISVSVVFRLK